MSDPGLQPERTALAWQRTGLSAAVVAALLLRTGISAGSVLDLIAGGSATAVVGVAWLTGRRPGGHRRRLQMAAAGVFATAVLATVRLTCG